MEWTDSGKETEPDKKHRVSLGACIKTPNGVRYKILHNEYGQILLDPVKSVPAREAWIYEKAENIESIQRGIAQAEKGQLVEIDLGPEDGEEN